MKLRFYIGICLLMLASCNKLSRPDWNLLLEGERLNQMTADGTLAEIDSLMWQQPDSALICLGHYFKPNDDNVSTIATRTEHDRRYAYLLLAELLFKNNYPQTCRENLLRSVDYFDSLMVADGADIRGVSLPFLDARAHYMNGVGYYEQDSVIDAYTEYIRALDIVENHF